MASSAFGIGGFCFMVGLLCASSTVAGCVHLTCFKNDFAANVLPVIRYVLIGQLLIEPSALSLGLLVSEPLELGWMQVRHSR